MTSARRIAFLIDPLASLHPQKDSTLALIQSGLQLQLDIVIFQRTDLWLEGTAPMARCTPLHGNPAQPTQGPPRITDLRHMDLIMVRTNPPFDMPYLYAMQMLHHASAHGLRVCNDPQALQTCNEKLLATHFPQWAVPTLIDADMQRLEAFCHAQSHCVLKPLDGMGGRGIFRLQHTDPNLRVVLECMTQDGQQPIVAQQYVPDIAQGDKRILIFAGEVVPYVLCRIPQGSDHRGNMARGGQAQGQPLSPQDRKIAEDVASRLFPQGLWLIGLDVIGDTITEINITSPTGLRELNAAFNLDLGAQFWHTVLPHL